MRLILLLLLILAGTAGCGQKGALFLPTAEETEERQGASD